MNARGLLGLAGVVLAAAFAYYAMGRLEGVAPTVLAPEKIVVGASGDRITLHVQDDGTGLRQFSARLLHAAGSQSLFEEYYPGDLLTGGVPDARAREVSLELDVAGIGLPDGPGTLVVSVRDWSWRGGLEGNRTQLSIPLTIDLRPPQLNVVSGLTYVYRGGSAAAVYRAAEDAVAHGVRVGDARFFGHPHPSGEPDLRVALFSIPVDAADEPEVVVFGVDAAGNVGEKPFRAHVLERVFGTSKIKIDPEFVSRVAAPLAEANGLDRNTPAEIFRAVNETLRASDEAAIRRALAQPSPAPLFEGGFDQLRGSKVMSRFAEERTYILEGQSISQARHYGFDLASTRNAPITAAAGGQIAYAGSLGIYGNCVIIDHGMGLASVYGHLADLEVEVGESVGQGDRLGHSGTTGLAAGDHLHFAILVGEHYVDPLEWWDPRWVHSHVQVRLKSSSP